MSDSDSETVSTPRRRLPLVTEKNSPRAVKPLATLDLSDEEIEQGGAVTSVLPARTLHINDSDDSEVVINYSRLSQKTPIRVIRHKNISEESRSTSSCLGEVSQARDQMNENSTDMCITGHLEEDLQSEGSVRPVAECRSPEMKTIGSSGGLDQGNSAAVHYRALLALSQNSKSPMRSSESDSTNQESNTGTDDLASNGARAADVKSAALPGNEIVSAKLKQKKKGGRIVASRYMQAASSTRGPMKATDHSLLPKSTAPAASNAVTTGAAAKSKRNSSLKEVNTGILKKDETNKSSTNTHHTSASSQTESKKSVTSSVAGGGRLKRSNSGPTLINCTPQAPGSCEDRMGKGGGRGLVSTPTADGSMFVGPDTVDVSAIISVSSRHPPNMLQSYFDDGLSDLAGPNVLFKRNFCSTSSNNSSRSQGSATHTSTDASDLPQVKPSDHSSNSKSKGSRELTQWDIELAHGRQAQWAFMTAMARKSFREQEKAAMIEIQSLWEAVESQKQHVNEIKAELTKLYCRSTVHEMLNMQSSSLIVIEDKLDELLEQHSSLVTALETTCHHLKTRGIYIPENDYKYMDNICKSLMDSYQLLSHIVSATFQQAPSISSFSQCLNSLNTVVNGEVLTMTRSNELLSAIRSLTTRENSLRIQLMQNR